MWSSFYFRLAPKTLTKNLRNVCVGQLMRLMIRIMLNLCWLELRSFTSLPGLAKRLRGLKWNLVESSVDKNANFRLFNRFQDLNTCTESADCSISRSTNFSDVLRCRLLVPSYLFSLRVLYVFRVSPKRVYIFENILETKLRGEFVFH